MGGEAVTRAQRLKVRRSTYRGVLPTIRLHSLCTWADLRRRRARVERAYAEWQQGMLTEREYLRVEATFNEGVYSLWDLHGAERFREEMCA